MLILLITADPRGPNWQVTRCGEVRDFDATYRRHTEQHGREGLKVFMANELSFGDIEVLRLVRE